jgi:hypothetical protein|tara:strand:- start:8795 stop:9277 length:483 start_codon:yes stop_codon:yes gene_type:complete
MAKVKLVRHRPTGPLLLRRGGGTYALTAQEETVVPLGIAVTMLGDKGLLIELDISDAADVLKLNDYLLNILKREFNVEGDAKAVKAALFPSAKKSFIPNIIKDTPVEEEPVIEEAPEEVAVETIDYSKYTVKKLKEMLEEKGLSTDGKKADLVERMSGAE